MSDYNETVIDHFANPRGALAIEAADLVGHAGVEGQGYWMTLYVRVEGDRIREATFRTYGCPSVIASGSALVEMVVGLTLAEAANLTAGDIDAKLGGLPLGKEHAPRIAIDALRSAIASL